MPPWSMLNLEVQRAWILEREQENFAWKMRAKK